MQLIYFDENKYSASSPYFIIGGILLPDEQLSELELTLMRIQYNFFGKNILSKETELHGIDLFQGKNNFRNRALFERIQLLENISRFLIKYSIPIRLVKIDVKKYKEKITFPFSEYNFGLKLILKKFCDYLSKINDIGIVFGDYEKDEVTQSIIDFSSASVLSLPDNGFRDHDGHIQTALDFSPDGKTLLSFGRTSERLKDTIYFTHSHHSRFLQIADLVVYLAGRFENNKTWEKWHDLEGKRIWENLKAKLDVAIENWS